MLDQAERPKILRQLLDPSTGCLEHRVAAMMLVLLGQPFTRIAAVRLSDVVVEGGEVSVRLGEGFVSRSGQCPATRPGVAVGVGCHSCMPLRGA